MKTEPQPGGRTEVHQPGSGAADFWRPETRDQNHVGGDQNHLRPSEQLCVCGAGVCVHVCVFICVCFEQLCVSVEVSC